MIHLDYETTSACDITLGAYRYACDPSTRILMFAISDGGAPLIWTFLNPDAPESVAAKSMLAKAITDNTPIYAHNAMFELAISTYRMLPDVGLEPPLIEQWRCTRTMALRAAIPSSLANAAAFLGLSDKDKKGKVLINIFSDQSKVAKLTHGKQKKDSKSPIMEDEIPWGWTMTVSGESMTVRDAWDAFISYCRQDVVVEQQLHAKLSKFELSGTELEGYQFDLRMNHRGVPVNRPALEHANRLLEEEQALLTAEFSAITGLQPSQTAKVLDWLKRHGYAEDNLQSATMKGQVGSTMMTEEGQRALEIRSSLSFAAIKKVSAMLNTVCPDDRMRGLFLFHGAQRTGRWTSSGPQLQNAKKPTIKYPDAAYSDICAGVDREWLSLMHGDTYETIASCIRNFVQPHQGRMLDLDLANIESRCAAFLSGCETDMVLYRQNEDLYKHLASVVFGVPVSTVTKDQRFVGKVGVLSLVFQTGAKTFFETCAAWGMPISKAIAARTVKTFRETRSEYPKTWRAYEAAAIKAINAPGTWFNASQYVSFARSVGGAFDRLLMRLPSDRMLVYPNPKITRTVKKHKDFETGQVREWESDDISFYGAMRGTAAWGRVSTFAGDLFQSSVQAMARDIVMHGCMEAEKSGFDIFSIIHDQALAHEGDVDAYHKAFTKVPPWLPQDFPLAAEAKIVDYYAKD